MHWVQKKKGFSFSFFCETQIAVCCFKCLPGRFIEPVKGFCEICDNLDGSYGSETFLGSADVVFASLLLTSVFVL